MNSGFRFTAARVVVGFVFIASALLKFISVDSFKIDIDSFELYIYSLGWFPLTVCFYIARLLVGLEFALGLALVTNVYRKWVDRVAYAVIFLFSLFLVYLIAVGYDGSCHCMGSHFDLPPIPSLLKNFCLAVLLFFSGRGAAYTVPYAEKFVPAISFVALVAMFIVSPPDGLAPTKQATVRPGYVEKYIKSDTTFQSLYAEQNKVLVCMFSTGCRVCRLSAKKLQLMVRKYNVPESKIYVLYHGDEHGRRVFEEQTGLNDNYRYSMLMPEDFGRMVATVPVFLLFEKGMLKRSFTYRTLDESVLLDLNGQ